MTHEPGDIVGPVRLAKLLRKDSTHILYEGLHLRLGVDVALRLMQRSASSEGFLQRARIAADTRHPALVPVIDFGELADVRYVVTARAYGMTLEQHLAEHDAPLAERALLRVLWRVGEALQALHAAGLAHGNLRPSSLLMDPRGRLRVTDLRFASEPRAHNVQEPDEERSLYWPPASEVAEDDAQAEVSRDLYALGAIAYEAVFRRMPHAPPLGDASGATPRFDAAAGYAPALLEVIERLIAGDPGQRIQSAGALLDALPPDPEAPRPTAAAKPRQLAPAHDSELLSILGFLQRRFGSRETQQAEGAVVHSSLRERVVVWLLLVLLLTGTVAALLAP